MSIAEKLGKMGIPGFRSGKTWKMIIATIGYIFIFMMLLAIISPTEENATPTAKIKPLITPVIPIATTTQPIAIATVVTTIEEPRSEEPRSVVIEYSAKKADSIGSYSNPKPGSIFLIVTMTIENHGYDEINTNPNYFSVIANSIKYDYTSSTFSLDDKLDTVNILDGGILKGSIAFEVPTNIDEFKLQYKSYKNYNVIYNVE